MEWIPIVLFVWLFGWAGSYTALVLPKNRGKDNGARAVLAALWPLLFIPIVMYRLWQDQEKDLIESIGQENS
jgi:hypothetical protein